MLINHFAGLRVEHDWITLGAGITGYTTEAWFDSDIPLPHINKVFGEAKFLDKGSRLERVHLGYKVGVDVQALDPSAIPAKYRREKDITVGGATPKGLPIEWVVYDVHLLFTLKDSDRFELLALESTPHSLYSGKDNVLQGILIDPVPVAIARRVSSIEVRMNVDKCITCERE